MQRIAGVLFALATVTAILSGWHAYLIQRLVVEPGFDGGWAWLIAGLGLSMPLGLLAERFVPPPMIRVLAWPSALWMGAAFELLVLVGLSDLLSLLVPDAMPAGPWARWRAVGVLSVATIVVVGGVVSAFRPRTKRVDVKIANWPSALDGFRIVQISDVHIGPILGARFARAIVTRVNALNPDLVAATGDLVDGPVRHLIADTAAFGELRAEHGVYFVTGNHDHYSGANPWCARWEQLGMHVLRNEHRTISSGGGSFALVGVDDYRGDPFDGERGQDLEAALHGIPAARPTILLAHDPTTFHEASQRGVDLQVSGHTHGGQIWPFRYAVRIAVRWVAGLYREGRSQVYVSRGTGFWGPPMRVFAPGEITELVLHRA